MKGSLPLAATALAALLVACATPIRQEAISSHLAGNPDLDTADIREFSNGYFALASRHSRYATWVGCAVAATDEELLVYVAAPVAGEGEGDPNDIDGGDSAVTSTEPVLDIRLPYRDITGVADMLSGKSHQIQILTRFAILALELTGEEGGTFLDNASARAFHEFILSKGVPGFTPQHRIGTSTGAPIMLPVPLPITVF